ncbi:RNI-like protein [Caulochytrium protostelioides]|nr:RNI-like protein [Caulochytrium protostelioides]
MRDVVLDRLSERSHSLASLHLDGPFLVSDAAFERLFQACPALKSVYLGEAAKFGDLGMRALTTTCTQLTELTLNHCTRVTGTQIAMIASLKRLCRLHLIQVSDAVEDEAFITVLQAIGRHLTHLSLCHNPQMTDRTLIEGVAPVGWQMRSLQLEDCQKLTDDGVQALYGQKSVIPPLVHLNLNRNALLSDTTLAGLIQRHGGTLQQLHLNGLDELTINGLRQIIALHGPHTRYTMLELSWIRSLTNALFIDIVEASPRLEQINVYGCNALDHVVLSRVWFNATGKPIRIVGNEFD